MKTTECQLCKKNISNNNIKKHIDSKSCVKPTKESEDFTKISDEIYRCNICNKEYRNNGIKTHFWRVHTEEGKKFNPNKGFDDCTRQAWNKGLTKENNEIVRKYSENSSKTHKEKFKNGESGGFCSPEYREYTKTEEFKIKHSNIMKLAVQKYPESYDKKNISGRVKNFNKSFWGIEMTFKGTWELTVAEFLFENNIKFTNKLTPIEYLWSEDNKIHLYFPDFYLPEIDKYIEVKGFERQRDIDKWSSFKDKENLIILKDDEIKQIKNKTFDLNNIVV